MSARLSKSFFFFIVIAVLIFLNATSDIAFIKYKYKLIRSYKTVITAWLTVYQNLLKHFSISAYCSVASLSLTIEMLFVLRLFFWTLSWLLLEVLLVSMMGCFVSCKLSSLFSLLLSDILLAQTS